MSRTNEYHFITQWRVRGSAEEVSNVLGNPLDLPRWWPSVYLAVREIEPAREDGSGAVFELLTKGRLPYKLRWCFRVTESRPPHGFSILAWGDFEGAGRWDFKPDGDFVNIQYDWRIRAEKPLLRYLSWALKPIFSANHRWAMERGEESLVAELARRRASQTS